ncbi:MAG TPA: cupin domain-containing protein [Thiotrichales bacterium]|nr:cupin domain-containing protein [Thiotrichales bacterium]
MNPLEPGDVEAFLSEYWQKKPLLIRSGMAPINPPLSADELAGLACEEDVNARLVLEHIDAGDNQTPWSVEYGPFDENRFATLPSSNWSLLVSDVEQHVAEAVDLIDKFRFIPDWRIDDLMISYAPPGGSVGPHTDAYDVFLIQLTGQREWQISTQYDNTLLKNTELSILENFHAEHRWVLNPGDMLYLPPGVAHHGIALEDCMTASVGFRAPAINTIVHDYADYIASKIDDSELYRDPDLKPQTHPAEISAQAIEKVKQILLERLTIESGAVKQWLGEYCSDTRSRTPLEPEQQFISFTDFEHALQSHSLHPASTSRFLFSRDGEAAILFVDGDSHKVPPGFAETLCQRDIDVTRLLQEVDASTSRLLLELYHKGSLVLDE